MAEDERGMVQRATDTELREQIAALKDEQCCPDPQTAALLLCGCRGRTPGSLALLYAEQDRRRAERRSA